MSKELLKILLKYNIWQDQLGGNLPSNFGDKNIKSVYNTIEESHTKNKTDLTVQELKALHYAYNPTLTQAAKANLDIFFNELEAINISDVVAKDLIRQNYLLSQYTELANLAMDGGDNKEIDLSKIDTIVNNIKSSNDPTETATEHVTTDIEDMLKEVEKEYRWTTPIPALNDIIGGFGEGVFIVVGARPNAMKTALCVALTFQSKGLLEQGAKVHMISNEEKAVRTMLRGVSSYTGMTKAEIIANKSEAARAFSKIKDNVFIKDANAMDLTELENYVRLHDIDVLFIDQLDKIRVNGSYANESDRLRTLYTATRELAKKYNICIFGVCQASNDAEGKLKFGFEALENSKTGKAAECDVCICIGKETFTGEDTGYRMLNVVKNKLTGNESSLGIMLNRDLSRITA